jgi:hypothetical protein
MPQERTRSIFLRVACFSTHALAGRDALSRQDLARENSFSSAESEFYVTCTHDLYTASTRLLFAYETLKEDFHRAAVN